MKARKDIFLLFFRLSLILISLVFSSIVIYLFITFEVPFFSPTINTIKFVIVSLLIPLFIFLTILAVLTINEFKNYFTGRNLIKQGRSYLNLTDIFENENRLNIINQILRNPGIHHNELQRNCDLQKGQLQWHLDVLLKYNIIKKEKYGQYTIYFPITTSFDANEYLENLISKSKTTTEILNIVKENPGINSSEISRILNLSRNTIKYHIDKLSEEKLVKLTKKGRKIEIYPILN
ncbi:MAG: winged helix-turn-helix transcriptional regulator [Candidatus Lokiarchaeota archaeon]|nr:winged helix-turn-helix transcriptional regulator [Candidatus Lokiarchaeota archaeon]